MSTPRPPALVTATSAADYDTLLPPENDDTPSEMDWIAAAPYWNAAPTMPLPPPPREYPVTIPDSVALIPTDVLPPALLDIVVIEMPSSIPPPPLLGTQTLASPPPPPPPKTTPPEPIRPTPTELPEQSSFDPISLEECATIDARLALHPNSASTLLEEYHLDEPTWTRHFNHWQERIRERLNQDDPSLLALHDDAFLAALEKNRGAPITANDHAALIASARKGIRAETLRTLKIPAKGISIVERVFLRRGMG